MPPERSFHLGHHPVPLAWHAALLRDTTRIDRYDRAIRQLVRPGMVVLDVGTGTGILALLAARRGARVHAVESGPIIGLARQLAAGNGLADRIVFHHGDLCDLPVAEPVDLVLGEFMGRMVLDDGMHAAVAAARVWAKTGARYCPGRLELSLAPVAASVPSLDLWDRDLLGLDLRAAAPSALRSGAALLLDTESLLGPPAAVWSWEPAQSAPALDVRVRLPIVRGGRLRGVAGWFRADLAPGVQLDTGPGSDTHWGQHLLPLAPTEVEPGDAVVMRLCFVEQGATARWEWSGLVEQRAGSRPFNLASDEALSSDAAERPARVAPGSSQGRDAAIARNRSGLAAAQAGDLAAALLVWEEAARCLGPDDDDIAPLIYENIGLAAAHLGQPAAAAQALLRALDGVADHGGPTGRTQARALLPACLQGAGQPRAAAQAARNDAVGDAPAAEAHRVPPKP